MYTSKGSTNNGNVHSLKRKFIGKEGRSRITKLTAFNTKYILRQTYGCEYRVLSQNTKGKLPTRN